MQVPAPFDYVRATSVGNALELLERHGPESRVIAGGHSLLPMMKLRLARPEWLIDINDVAELRHITEEPDWLRVGALTRHAALLASDVVGRLFPIVHDAEKVIADPVVRNRGTIGGSLGQADPAEDLTTVCDVLRAQVVIAAPGGRARRRHGRVPPRPLRDRVRAARTAHRDPLPDPRPLGQRLREGRAPGRRLGGRRRRRRPADGRRRHDRRRRDRPHRPRARGPGHRRRRRPASAQRPSEDLFAEAGRLAAAASSPVEDQRGPVDYKRHLADELTRRVLRRALDRAAHATAVQGG